MMQAIPDAPGWFLREDGSIELHERTPDGRCWYVVAIVTRHPASGFRLTIEHNFPPQPLTLPPAALAACGTLEGPGDCHRSLETPSWLTGGP